MARLVTSSDLPRGFKAWPNKCGADSRLWSCMLHPNGQWTCRKKSNGVLLEGVSDIHNLPKGVRRSSKGRRG